MKTIINENFKSSLFKDLNNYKIHSPHYVGGIKLFPVSFDKQNLDNKISLSEDEPSLYYDTYDPESLQAIIDTQRKIVEHQKLKNQINYLVF